MMPSRGLHIVRQGNAPQLFQLQCRNLSSASRRICPTAIRLPLASPLRSQQWRAPMPVLTPTAQSTRHASTNPQQPTSQAAQAASAPPPPPPAETTSAFPDMDTITLDNIDLSTIPESIANIPEKIGYLSEIGLNYGYGPTSMLEWTMEHLHIYVGLPWWGSIAATAVLLRMILFPLYLKSSDVTARQQALVSITKPITDKMSAAQRSKNTEAVMQAYGELRAIRARAGISFRAQFAPLIVQGIFGYCGFKLLRAASYLPVPAFKTDGFLWLSDLTVPDPYLILPMCMGASLHLLARIGGETGAQTGMTPGMMKVMLYVMPVFITIITGWQPGAVCVWFAAGGALGIAQSLSLKQAPVRKFFGLAPLYKPPKGQEYKSPTAAWMEGVLKKREVPPAVDVVGKSRPASSSVFESAAAGGKNAEFMRPQYQSPNLRRTSSISRTSSTTTNATAAAAAASSQWSTKPPTPQHSRPPTSQDDMLTPAGTPSATSTPAATKAEKEGGVFARASKGWKDFRGRTQDFVKEKMAEQEREKGNVDQRMREEQGRREKMRRMEGRGLVHEGGKVGKGVV